MAAGSKQSRNPASCLTDDLVVEILSRLPVKSICRFKCVSKQWRDIISHPDHRKKLPQTLAGFFYHTNSSGRIPESARHFTNVTGRGAPLICPSLSFLPGYVNITISDCCNGLLLCHYRTTTGNIRYIVCNPATEEWIPLPESSESGSAVKAWLGFDPAVSPHFYVFEFVETFEDAIPGELFDDELEIYSSETGEWVHRGGGWSDNAILWDDMNTVFLNGFLHVFASTHEDVLVVNTEGKSWTIPVPCHNDYGFVGLSQGHLYYMSAVEEHDFNLSIYVLEDYGTHQWIFKHSVSTEELLGMHSFDAMPHYTLIAVHPDCHLIYFISDLDNTIRCYDMEHRKVNVICNIGCNIESLERCLAYVPLFSESSGWN